MQREYSIIFSIRIQRESIALQWHSDNRQSPGTARIGGRSGAAFAGCPGGIVPACWTPSSGEDLYLIDGKTGDRIHVLNTSTQREGISYDSAIQNAIEQAHSEGRSIIAIHNHPNGLPPTLDDGSSAFVHGYDKGIAVGHNLEVFVYGKSDKEYSTDFCKRVHASISKVTVFNVDFEEEIWYATLRKYGMEVERR